MADPRATLGAILGTDDALHVVAQRMKARADRAEAAVGRLRAALASVEYTLPGHGRDDCRYCAVCGWRERTGHAPECRIGAALTTEAAQEGER